MVFNFNLYNINPTFGENSLEYDCLIYHSSREKLAYQELSDIVDENIEYCFRPENITNLLLLIDITDPLAQNLSFYELSMTNITAQQLFSWSIPIEIIERYQYYLNEQNNLLNEYFYNCTQRRFGFYCQYSFEFGEEMSFEQIVQSDFNRRTEYTEPSNITVSVPCYTLLTCHRNKQSWCLDWREICDGKVDCFDESLDEEFCFDLEINECDQDEYRCHNGLCISQQLWEDGLGEPDCLDRSDTNINLINSQNCFKNPTFNCEEKSCRPGTKSFSCGDGQCVVPFEKCRNGRHELLRQSIRDKGNVNDECWRVMICVTRLIKNEDEDQCKIWFMNITVNTILERCGSFFQFPTIPTYSNHIRFFYNYSNVILYQKEILLPDYICYDKELCDVLKPDFSHENLGCIKKPKQIYVPSISSANLWSILLNSIENYFRSCSYPQITFRDKPNFYNYSSLYKCNNSSKFISKHRIMDKMKDCFNVDDENYQNSCQLNNRYRVQCFNDNICWSPLLINEVCRLNSFYFQKKISFPSFCDGLKIFFKDNHGVRVSDEDGCGDWICNNMYTRCDGFWTCQDGRDEENCGRKICPSNTFACISPFNYSIICLNYTAVNDSIDDCLGALDEQSDCRISELSGKVTHPFRCLHDDRCIKISQLCDNHSECTTDNDDEEFCQNQSFSCKQNSLRNRTDIEEVLCGLKEIINNSVKYFSVYTSTNYPLLENDRSTEFKYQLTQQDHLTNINVSQNQSHIWPWYCNRGLVIQVQNSTNRNIQKCLCPPSYYGELCQYQNQRVSLTLYLTSNNRFDTYEIIIMLINEEEQKINTFKKFIYIVKQSCTMKLNRYLLYSKRPKNISNNYIIRIDIFEKITLTYVGSWYFPISFVFLPVNRLSVSLNIRKTPIKYSLNCSNMCQHGQCVKYINKNKYFCQCYAQWFGIYCNISINCQSCSSDSICIGSSQNQSICVCPMGKFGKRCLLTSTCPINSCKNNGKCIPADLSISETNYTCLCDDRFFGKNCEYEKAKIDISFQDIHIPLYVIAYFFTLSNTSEPIETIILRKLTIFQHTVTFHITIPYQLIFIQANNKYYLATLQQYPKQTISTIINPKQECITVENLFNSTILNLNSYQRIIHYHYICQIRHELICFIDETYLCLCTNDHHANCLEFNGERNFQCHTNNDCQNNGQCLQDHPNCPSIKICLCPNCYFGNQCQFYAKGLGSTLDEILGYEIKRNIHFFSQPITVQISGIISILIFVIGFINSIIAIMIFTRKKPLEVGCGTYILASSITSLITMILAILKFWLLFYSYQYDYEHSKQKQIFRASCYIEPLLKGIFYLDSWCNACVGIERTVSICKGVNFNKKLSKQIARWIVLLLCLIISGLLTPQVFYLYILNDSREERSWCVIKSNRWLSIYSPISLFFNYFSPLIINIFSAVFIIMRTTYQRAIFQTDHSWWFHLKSRIKNYRHTLISFTIIVCLTLPHLIISLILDCKKSSNLIWFYLIGYFFSFLPATSVCIIFVLPSPLYKEESAHLRAYLLRRIQIFKLNWFN